MGQMPTPFRKGNRFCRYMITFFLYNIDISANYGFVTFVKSNALLLLTLSYQK